MDAEEFLKRVSVRAGIHNRDQTRAATRAVFQTLRARILHEMGDNVVAQLPGGLKELWESGLISHAARSVIGFERMDLEEFIERIQNDPALRNIANARDVTCAVFTTLREQITPGAAQKLASELPEDIRAFWQSCTPETTPEERPRREPAAASEEMQGEVPVLGPEYDVPTGADIETGAPQTALPRMNPPEGQYGSEGIGPSAAIVFRSDDQIESEVEDLLDANDEIDASTIDVEVHQGKVLLRGAVRSADERQIAEHIAREAIGTIEVIDELDVENE